MVPGCHKKRCIRGQISEDADNAGVRRHAATHGHTEGALAGRGGGGGPLNIEARGGRWPRHAEASGGGIMLRVLLKMSGSAAARANGSGREHSS